MGMAIVSCFPLRWCLRIVPGLAGSTGTGGGLLPAAGLSPHYPYVVSMPRKEGCFSSQASQPSLNRNHGAGSKSHGPIPEQRGHQALADSLLVNDLDEAVGIGLLYIDPAAYLR